MSLEDIVNVQISRETKVVSRTGFGVINIFGTNKGFTSLLKEYTTIASVLLDFNTNDAEYLAALAAFSQSPSPIKIAISRRDTSDTSTVTVITAANTTLYTITINDVAFTFTSDSDATVVEIAEGLGTAINAGSEPVTADFSAADGTFTLVADVALVPYSVLVDTKQTIAYVTSQSVALDLADITNETDDWYGLILTSRVQADVEAAAAYVETVVKLFISASAEADIADTTDAADTTTVAAVLKAAAYARSGIIYHTLAATQYPDAAALASILPLDPGSYTLMFKTLTSITKDVITPTQRTNILAKNANMYTEVGGVNIIEEGKVAEGEWVDVIVFVDWLQARITENVFAVLVNLPKVPYTDGGITAIQAEVISVLQQGTAVGGIAPDDGDDGPGFTTSVPEAADVSSGDKASRTLNDVTFDAILAGAIHAVNITGVVTP